MSDQRPVTVRVRRAPRFGVFLVLGGLAGVLASLIVVTAGGGAPEYTVFTSFTYFAAIFIIGGLLVGAVAALVTEWSMRRRARNVQVLGSFAPVADPAGESGPAAARPAGTASEKPDAAPAPENTAGSGPDVASDKGDGDHTNMRH